MRAALAVRAAVGLLNDEAPGRDLHVRVAVNPGEALVALGASPRQGEAMVAGDVVNTAARLQAAAPDRVQGQGDRRQADLMAPLSGREVLSGCAAKDVGAR